MKNISLDCLPLSLFVGYAGENDARGFAFDYSSWTEEYGAGVLQMLLQRPGDANPYPVLLSAGEDGTAVWLPSATDTDVKGKGEIQLIYTVNQVIAKTAVLPVLIERSLGAGTTPPDPYETWVDELLEIGNKILQDYQAPKIVGGYWYEFDADLGEYVSTGVKAEGQDGVGISNAVLNADYTLTLTFSDGTSYTTPSIRGKQGPQGETGATPAFSIGAVTTLPAGSPATAEMTGTPEAPVLNLGLPQGLKGDAGNGDMIADDFSTSTDYAAGDYAIYNGHLYRFTAAHAAGAWIGTDAVQVQLAEDVADLTSHFTQELTTELTDVSKWAQGYWAIANGSANNSNTRIRTVGYLDDDVLEVYDNSNLYLYLQAWNKSDETYVGTWNGTQWSTTYTARTGLLNIDLAKFRKEYPNYKFKITVTKTDSSNINPATNGSQIYFVYSNVIDIKSDISVLRENEIHSRKKLSENNSTPYVYRDLIPTYYFAQEQYPTSYDDNEYLQKKISSVPDGKHFIFITDRHWERNAKKSTMLVSYVASKLGINFIVDGGDSITREDTNENVEGRYLACKVLQSCLNSAYDSWGYKYLPVIGNHDINTANPPSTTEEALLKQRISYDALVNILFSSLNGETVHYAPSEKLRTFLGEDQTDYNVLMDYFSLNYYIDDNVNKIRFIIYNTGNPYNGVVMQHFGRSVNGESTLILDWLYTVLYETPENYDIVVVGHEPTFITNPPLTNTTKPIPQMVAARKQKVNTKVYLNESSAGTGWISNGNHYYDFRAASDVGKVFMLGGHWHRDYIVTVSGNTFENIAASLSTDTDVTMSGTANYPVIYTQCDAYNVASDSGNYHEMTLDTITEQCFDIVTITENGITCTRIGAGVDRTVTFT